MDDHRFDAFARALAEGASRRRVVKGLLGGLIGGAAISAGVRSSAAQDTGTGDVETTEIVCASHLVCGEGCCEEGDRCCEGRCIPADGCCWDGECDGCSLCHDFQCHRQCDPEFCCGDEKSGLYCAEQCCSDAQCQEEWECGICHGGWCIDGCEPKGLVCCAGFTLTATEHGGPVCSECCEHGDCGACELCVLGSCEPACEKDALCCDLGHGEWACGAECCVSGDCGGCEECVDGGWCDSYCESGEICCHGEFCHHSEDGCCGIAGDWCEVVAPASGKLDGSCCGDLYCCANEKTKGATCAECCEDEQCGDGQFCCGGVCAHCCSDEDCLLHDDDDLDENTGVCVEGHCLECRTDKDCPEGHCFEGWCSQCATNDHCRKGDVCCDGKCFTGECCYGAEVTGCGDCEKCWDDYQCHLAGIPFGEICGPVVGIAEGSPQLNCCDGLFCCETGEHGLDLVCLGCCHDGDCAKGCTCEKGSCTCGCGSDKDCGKGTCCCKNGSCSEDCCGATVGGEVVAELPSTGTGSSQSGSGMIGAAVIGAAAAFVASKAISSCKAAPATTEE